jgi:peroxiredoxin
MATETKTATLSTGQLIPNFSLSAANRHGQVGPWDYKQHRNLVLIFFRSAECQKCKQLLREIAEHYGDYKEKEAEVLVISSDEIDCLRQLAQDLALPFPVLSDTDGRVTDLYLKHTTQFVEPAAFEDAIFVADRWGAIFSTKRIEKDHDVPTETEIREWLEFIELQCEECFPSEWPLE